MFLLRFVQFSDMCVGGLRVEVRNGDVEEKQKQFGASLGNFLSCSKGLRDPLEVPEVRCD